MRATKLVDNMKNSNYSERLQRLNLPTLAYRRMRGDVIELFKHFRNTIERSSQRRFNQRYARIANTIINSMKDARTTVKGEFKVTPSTTAPHENGT